MVLEEPLLGGYRIFLQEVVVTSQVTSGVPQGSVLGPLLFICYINDLPKEVNSAVKLYADDVLLYRAIHSIADRDMLQKDLDIINKWAESWQMTFNLSKCELVRVTNKSTLWNIATTCKGSRLNQCLMQSIWV